MTLYLANTVGGASQMSQIVASPMLFSDAGYIQVFMLWKPDGPTESVVKLDLRCPLRQRDQLLPCPEAISGLAAHVAKEKCCSLFALDMATRFDFVAGGNSVTVNAEHVPELGAEMPFTCAFLNSVGQDRRYIVDADSDLTALLVANVLYGVWRHWSKNRLGTQKSIAKIDWGRAISRDGPRFFDMLRCFNSPEDVDPKTQGA